MNAIAKYSQQFRLPLIIGVMTVILILILSSETASATVVVVSRSFDLDQDHNGASGIWSDGTTLWVVEHEDSIAEKKALPYNLTTGERLLEQEFVQRRWVVPTTLSKAFGPMAR